MMKGRNNAARVQLGCRRGELKDEMPKVRLCPERTVADRDAVDVAQEFNESSRKVIQKRQEALTEALAGNLSLLNFDFELELFVQSLEPFHTNCVQKFEVEIPSLQVLLPLHECLFFIAWECCHSCKSQSILEGDQTVLEALGVLRSATNYQVAYEGVSN
jgi:hypothetical protein